MATPVTMPQMGYDMTEGSVQNWIKKEGDKVEKGEMIAEIETDKASVEMEAFASGVLKKIVVQPGQLVPVGTVIAVIADENEELDYKALGINDGGGGNTAAVQAKTDSAVDVGASRKSAGEGGESLSPDAAISLKEVLEADPKAQRVAEGKAATDGTQKKVPTTGPGTSTFSRRPAAGLVNLSAPVSAAGGPGGAAVPSETGEELTKAGQTAPTNAPGKGEGDEAAAQGQVVAAPTPQTPAASAAPQAPATTSNGAATGPNGRIKSSPLARKVANEAGVDLAAIGTGTGPGGRIVRADVENYAQSAPAATAAPAPLEVSAPAPVEVETAAPVAPASAPPPVAVPGADYSEQPLTRMRQTIARRLTESKQKVPHIYITNDVDMTEALKLRQSVNASLADSGVKISVGDMVTKAVAKALRKYPSINNAYMDDKIRVNHRVNVSIAVSLDDGLITPTIFDADQKSISQISTETRTLAEKARAGKLRPEEYQGGTFSISNMGMYDVSSFVAVINPPQAAILAVASTKPAVVLTSGSPEEGNAEFGVIQQMTVTISADHRIIDGAVAAQFLQEFKRLLQKPMLLLV